MANNLPLLSALEAYAARGALRFHMPGHKGRALYGGLFADACALDVTELTGHSGLTGAAGDLYRGTPGSGDPIRRAEALFAAAYGARDALFLTGGASQGVFSMLFAAAGAGGRVLIDRLCHQSVCYAAALLGLEADWLPRARSAPGGVAPPVSPNALKRALDSNTGRPYDAVMVTSPTYNGVCSDIGALADICGGIPLLADAAHGAHLPFLPDGAFGGAFSPGRDLTKASAAVISAHKTLPALGQAAVILTGGPPERSVCPARLREGSRTAGTSSPSYAVMASIDSARAFLDAEGADAGRRLCGMLRGFESPLLLRSGPEMTLDPLRLTMVCGDGPGMAARLREYGAEPEAVSDETVVLIVSLYEQESALESLLGMITRLGAEFGGYTRRETAETPAPRAVMPLRDAFFSRDTIELPLSRAAGMVSAAPFAPYPPGVALLMPGEVLTRELADMYPGAAHRFCSRP